MVLRQPARDQVRYFGIFGMGRSGSTYLETRIGTAANAVAVGELPSIVKSLQDPQKLCSCGAGASSCPFWVSVRAEAPWMDDPVAGLHIKRMNGQILPIRRVWKWPFYILRWQRGGSPTWSSDYLEAINSLYRAIGVAAREHGYSGVIDSSKHPMWLAGARWSGALDYFHDPAIIRLVRNPRAVAYSLERPHSERTRDGNQVIQLSYSTGRALPYWAAMNLIADWVAGPDAKRIRYEDLSDDWIRQLADTSAASATRGAHQVIANPARFAPHAELRRDERWRTAPSSRRARLMWQLARPLLRRYGYD